MGVDADAERQHLLEELNEARQKAAQLPTLMSWLTTTFFADIQRRIETEVDGRHSIKLPAAFFLLVRRAPEALARFDAILTRLEQEGQEDALVNVIERLLDPKNYRRATGALFEVDVLTALLENQELQSGAYPKIPGTDQKSAEASIRVQGRLVYVEATVITQTEDQELLQDLAITSAYRGLSPEEEAEAEGLRATIENGIASGTGRPYNDAHRAITKLDDKRDQLAPTDPNVICLGIADHDPSDPSVEWAVRALFSGDGRVLEILVEQIRRGLREDGNQPGTPNRAKAEAFLGRVEELRGRFVAEPRITAVAIYRWTGDQFSPHRLHRNPQPGSNQVLSDAEWAILSEALGFGTV